MFPCIGLRGDTNKLVTPYYIKAMADFFSYKMNDRQG